MASDTATETPEHGHSALEEAVPREVLDELGTEYVEGIETSFEMLERCTRLLAQENPFSSHNETIGGEIPVHQDRLQIAGRILDATTRYPRLKLDAKAIRDVPIQDIIKKGRRANRSAVKTITNVIGFNKGLKTEGSTDDISETLDSAEGALAGLSIAANQGVGREALTNVLQLALARVKAGELEIRINNGSASSYHEQVQAGNTSLAVRTMMGTYKKIRRKDIPDFKKHFGTPKEWMAAHQGSGKLSKQTRLVVSAGTEVHDEVREVGRKLFMSIGYGITEDLKLVAEADEIRLGDEATSYLATKAEYIQELAKEANLDLSVLWQEELQAIASLRNVQIDSTASAGNREMASKNATDNLNQFLAFRDRQYTLIPKQLRKEDKGLEVTNTIRLGHVASESENWEIESTDPDFAKQIAGLLFQFNKDINMSGKNAAVERLHGTMIMEAEIEKLADKLRGSLNGRDAYVTRIVKWIAANKDGLLAAPELSGTLHPAIENIGWSLADGEQEIIEDSEIALAALDTQDEDEPNTPSIPIEVFSQAKLLDLEIFPPEATDTQLQEDFEDIFKVGVDTVEWFRITGLVALRDEFNNVDGVRTKLYRGKPGSLATKLPYYVLEIERDGTRVIVAENPEYGNATYVYREDEELGEWPEVVSLSKKAARELGATRFFHSEGSPESHVERIKNSLVSEFSAV